MDQQTVRVKEFDRIFLPAGITAGLTGSQKFASIKLTSVYAGSGGIRGFLHGLRVAVTHEFRGGSLQVDVDLLKTLGFVLNRRSAVLNLGSVF